MRAGETDPALDELRRGARARQVASANRNNLLTPAEREAKRHGIVFHRNLTASTMNDPEVQKTDDALFIAIFTLSRIAAGLATDDPKRLAQVALRELEGLS